MEFIDKLNWRYATKKFSGQKVSDADLNTITEAIRLSPSSSGTQPYHIVVASGEMKDKLIQSSGQVDKLGASHMLVFCSRTDYPARGEKQIQLTAEAQGTTVEALAGFAKMISGISGRMNPAELEAWAARQAYIALGVAVSVCAEMQIDSCPMEGFKPAEFASILGLPEYMHPVVIMTLGYRDPADPAQPSMRAKMRFPKDDLFDFR